MVKRYHRKSECSGERWTRSFEWSSSSVAVKEVEEVTVWRRLVNTCINAQTNMRSQIQYVSYQSSSFINFECERTSNNFSHLLTSSDSLAISNTAPLFFSSSSPVYGDGPSLESSKSRFLSPKGLLCPLHTSRGTSSLNSIPVRIENVQR